MSSQGAALNSRKKRFFCILMVTILLRVDVNTIRSVKSRWGIAGLWSPAFPRDISGAFLFPEMSGFVQPWKMEVTQGDSPIALPIYRTIPTIHCAISSLILPLARCCSNNVSTIGQRRRRWPIVETSFDFRLSYCFVPSIPFSPIPTNPGT